MRAALKLELIGDDGIQALRRYGVRMPQPWVARIVGRDSTFGFKRRFERGIKDYTHANSVGSRGVYMIYTLEPGLYEVQQRISWKQWKRRYLWVKHDGTIEDVLREDIDAWLK